MVPAGRDAILSAKEASKENGKQIEAMKTAVVPSPSPTIRTKKRIQIKKTYSNVFGERAWTENKRGRRTSVILREMASALVWHLV